MTGILARIEPGAVDRLQTHLVGASLVLEAEGAFSAAQVLAALNSVVQNPLAGAELTDLNDIESVLAAKPTVEEKLRYLLLVESTFIAVESGALTNEAAARSTLGI